MYQDTVTLFNYHSESGYWFPTVLTGVDVGEDKSGKNDAKGIQNEDIIYLLVPCSANKTVNVGIKSKPYLSPKEYSKTSNPAKFITFDKEQDFIVIGEYNTTPIDDNNEAEGLYHRLNDELDGVYSIKSCSFYGLLPHFEIIGK